MILTIVDFFGRLHPVLVHLPIGILLLACFFQLLTLKQRFAYLQPAIPVAFFWGMISAIAACISGFLLSRSGDYDAQLVSRHQWMGIGVAAASVIVYFLHKRSAKVAALRWTALLLTVLIAITGHLGGSLTHGTDYLSAAFKSEGLKGPAIKPIANIQEAVVYTDMVQPLLQARCYTCHGPSKQKGKLRLDDQKLIIKGGESGKTVVAGRPDESEMIERLLLPLKNEDHMPPKEKAQLTQDEIDLLHWWIANGASFTSKVKELEQTNKIKPVLAALQSGSSSEQGDMLGVPEKPVEKASEEVLAKLRNLDVIIMPVSQNSNYLSINFVTARSTGDSVISLLPGLQKQLVWLKLDDATIGDEALEHLAKCTNLSRLNLSNTAITDKGLERLRSLQQLQSLNLIGTNVTTTGVMQLRGLKNLKNIYLYRTAINKSDWVNLQKSFPSTLLDSGNYKVPTLAQDTTEVKTGN